MSAAYALFGSGGATVYAIAIGGRDHEKAGKSMTASVVIAFLTGVLIVLFGSVFSSQITVLLCRNPMLHIQFEKYLLVLLLAAPLEIVVLTFVSILPAAGYPGFSTAVNVIANVVNIAMDYVNIHYFHMNVEGAAWATLTGYVCAALLVLFALAIRKMKIARILERNGFIRMSAETSRISLNRGYTKEGFADKVYHIHLRYAGDNDELYFRDFLNEHPRIAGEYESLKLKLWKRYEHDRDAYTHEKTEFIRKWIAEARRIYGNRYL